MPRTSECAVLVAGAGPTGLMLALWLARKGVDVRIIDKTAEAGTTSRALVVHARTLEFFQQLGLADEAIARGRKFAGMRLWAHGEERGHVVLGDIGEGLSPFPFMLILPQDEQERLLIEALGAQGIEVERRTELLSFEDQGEKVVATLRRADGTGESCACAYLAGCDGTHSTVRHDMQVDFPGATYAHMFYVADVRASGPMINGDLNLALDTADFLAIFPMPGEGKARLIGTVKNSAAEAERLQWKDVSPAILERLKVNVEHVNWFSTYHVHHRVANQFRKGRAFLLGDAAHIHSPVGGQGMNTGLGDAVNLAWKLAMVLEGRSDARLLDTYEPERIAFARRLVATTDRAFTFVTSDGALARRVREDVAPRVIPAVMELDAARRYMFRTVSQILIDYRESPLSAGRAGRVHGGDRLPWTGANYAPLQSLDWQVHVYGPSPETILVPGVPTREFRRDASVDRAGFRSGAAYLVRPDGYVALAGTDARAIGAFMQHQVIR
ncbi:FAD-dependent oxidoreductase [Betaproteobacteria bacterium GR16-43]|nr:FAD-dependent oxidoreductase [Betaproteobacteria bacterium GR16-43]